MGWQYVPAPGGVGKPKKRPLNPRTSWPAAVDAPETWATFELAVEAANDELDDEVDGIGFVFTAEDPFVGIDIDHCRNPRTGVLDEAAAALVRLLDSYTEISPSGCGVHVIARAVLPGGGRRRGDVELYDRGRYFTVTGQHLPGTPNTVNDRQDAVLAEYERLGAPSAVTEPSPQPVVVPVRSDEEALTRARSAANGGKFVALYDEGAWSGRYGSQSEADQALCDMLAYWCGDGVQVDRLFRASALMRPKWDELHSSHGSTYGEKAVANALERAGATAVATAPRERRGAMRFVTAAELAHETPEDVEWVITGIAARRAVTDLTAMVKAGKTTFLAAAIAACLQDRPFLDLPTQHVPVVYLTEERPLSFRQALARVGLVDATDLHVLVRQEARGHGWPEIVARAAALAKEVGAGLLVVDTLPDWAGFEGDAENSAGTALDAVRPLQEAADAGLAVIFVRHDRKGGGDVAVRGRGSSAIAGAADILLSLSPSKAKGHPNRRELRGEGRFDDALRRMVIEWREGGYEVLGDGAEVERREARQLVLAVLPREGEGPVTVNELEAMFEGTLSSGSLDRGLRDLRASGEADRCKGYGKRKTAFGYWRTGSSDDEWTTEPVDDVPDIDPVDRSTGGPPAKAA